GGIIAVLAFRLDPLGTFSDIMKRGRTGISGETYAFDSEGQMISESRFIGDLATIGIIKPGETSILKAQVRNPGLNLVKNPAPEFDWATKPLTLMASSALSGSDGFNLDGYNDYRGVPVIGAWHWHDESAFGVATEVDHDEAYALLRQSQAALLVMSAVASLLVILLALYAHRNELRIKEEEKALRLAKDDADDARSIAEHANQAKSEFLSSMSHELRTPMNAILGFAQLMQYDQKTPLNGSQVDSVSNILKGGKHLLELIDQVLELSKIEAGKLTLSIEPIPPRQVIDECLSLIEGRAGERGIRILDGTADDTLPILHADYTRLKQVLLNLLSNAIKYNRDGGTVKLSSRMVPDNMLRIAVADTGQGIPADKCSKLFKPFERLGKENSSIEGTGIGLTITKQIVELLGGSIGFESKQGEGSIFWIDLPISDREGKRETDGNQAHPPLAANVTRMPVNSATMRTILYVEDNPANMQLMEALITQIPNVSLLTAVNAESGIELARTQHPDLILMDINLPGMDGIAALNELRKGEATCDTPVIAVTAGVLPKSITAITQAGFQGHLTKPLDIKETENVIREFLRQARAA
ncbi:MAG: ATP-binding protein, partial [Rhodospirillales bacterium]|nr:ATP-binding protein [Rhodospirillales bacterium]